MSLRNNKKKLIAGVSIAALAGSYFLGPHLIKSYIESKYPFVKIQSARFIFIGICFDNIIVNKPNIKADIDKVCVKGIRGPLIVNGGHASLSIVENITHHHNDKNILDQFNEVYISGIDATVTKGNDSADLSGISYTKTNSEDYLAFESANIKYKEKKFDATGGKIRRDLSSAEIETVHTEFPLPFKIPHIDPPHSVIANKLHINIKGKVVKIADIRYGFLHIQNTEARLSLKDINASAQFVSIDHAWLASSPIVFTNATASSKPPFRDFDIALGEAKMHTDLVDYQASGFGSCSEWAKALPKPNILEKVADSFSGALSFTINVHPKPEFKLVNTCKFKCSSQPINNLFSPYGFTYSVYDKDNKLSARHIGPNEKGWASIEEISPDLLLAVNALEDPGFQGHKGVIPLAIKNSLLANLKEGKFARGGSTITMQLAKNLWLNRQKVLLRKVEEIFLAFALESCLTKEQIIEWYLNAVEFGPDIYGVRAATRYYFKKDPHELTPVEAFYLAKILPNPKGAIPPLQGGLESAQKLIDHFAKSGFAVGL